MGSLNLTLVISYNCCQDSWSVTHSDAKYMYIYLSAVDPLKHLQYYRCVFLMVDPCNRLHKFIAYFITKHSWF